MLWNYVVQGKSEWPIISMAIVFPDNGAGWPGLPPGPPLGPATLSFPFFCPRVPYKWRRNVQFQAGHGEKFGRSCESARSEDSGPALPEFSGPARVRPPFPKVPRDEPLSCSL